MVSRFLEAIPRQSPTAVFPLLFFFMCGLLFALSSALVFQWERNASRKETGLLIPSLRFPSRLCTSRRPNQRTKTAETQRRTAKRREVARGGTLILHHVKGETCT